jgi:hypothetical protein
VVVIGSVVLMSINSLQGHMWFWWIIHCICAATCKKQLPQTMYNRALNCVRQRQTVYNRVLNRVRQRRTVYNRVLNCVWQLQTVRNCVFKECKPCPTVLDCVPNWVWNISTSVLNHVQPCHLRWAPCPTVSYPNSNHTYCVDPHLKVMSKNHV